MSQMKTSDFQAIVLAAGKGTRMGSDLPKVLLPVCGRPVITYILDALDRVGIPQPVVIIGYKAEKVRDALGSRVIYALQEEQRGSGHAVMCAREAAGDAKDLLVMCGDSPLFRVETISAVMDAHVCEDAVITLASAILDDPTGYGRILRGPNGDVVGVAEEKIATPEQKAVKEINGGLYAFDGDWLWENIHLLHENEAGELCLTEMVDIAIAQGRKVIAVPIPAEEVAGINTPEQLRAAERVLSERDGQMV